MLPMSSVFPNAADARNRSYNMIVTACEDFSAKAVALVEVQGWSEQVPPICGGLEKVHVLFPLPNAMIC